jgi:hypothetical protein
MFYIVVTISECPQSVHTSFVPATVFSRTSWTVFEWHFMHSLETVSGLVMGHIVMVPSKFNLISCRNYEIRFYSQTNGRRGSEAWPNAQDSRSDVHGTNHHFFSQQREKPREMSDPVP